MEQQPTSEQPTTPTSAAAAAPKKSLSLPAMFGLGLVGVVVIALCIAYAVVLRQVHAMSMNPTVLTIAKTLHIPAASVNGVDVPYSDFTVDLEVLRKFHAQNPEALGETPTDEAIAQQVLSRLMANALIGKIAKQYDVDVTDKQLSDARAQLLAGFPDQAAAEKELQDQYGWTVDTYVNRVVKPVLLEQAVQEAFSASTDDAGKQYEETGRVEVNARHILFPVEDTTDTKADGEVKKQATDVLNRLKAGEDFATLAKQYGSDGTKDNGGDLGWFGEGIMVQEFEKEVFKLEPGQLGPELVKTKYGYHIVKLEGKRTPRNFAAFMDDQLRSARIKVYINVPNPFAELSAADEAETTSTATSTVTQ